MRPLKWLHLSDIHFHPKWLWQNVPAREQLLIYLKQCFQEAPELLPDLIFCTGDIAFSALHDQTPASQYEQAKKFFEKLLLLCNLNKDRLFVVPGNYDVDRMMTSNRSQVADSRKSALEINRHIDENTLQFQTRLIRLADYIQFTKDFLPHQYDENGRAFYANKVQVADLPIGICGLNSTWFCSSSEVDSKLWLGAEWQFDHARPELKDTSLRIALMHHPLTDLTQTEQHDADYYINHDFHFFLHGHSHNAWVEPGKCTAIAAGVAGTARTDEFGINLVQLDLSSGKGKVHLHRYDRLGWMIAPVPVHAPRGVWEFDLPQSLHHIAIDQDATLSDPNNATKHAAALLDKSIAIQSLELNDIRGFTNLKLDLTLPPVGAGQWVVFLGQNGVGKTTLLRSLALALRNLDDRPIWPDAFSGWPRTIDNNGTLAKHAWIKTVLADGSVHQTNIISNGSTKFTQTPAQLHPSQSLLFAYGCRRGSTTGGPKREYSFDKEGGPEIATLFEEFAGMVHAETWLKDLSNKPALLRAVLDAIKTFLDVAAVQLQDGNLLITEHDKPPLALKQLSDGYLTSAGWFIDLLARWIDYAERQGKTITPGFMQEMRGLVLIDEIDMHLHPRWQIEIIRRTRTLMPQMSFIVTTHNPLTLVGAKAEEIWILENDGGNIVATRGVEAPMLLTGGQIYTRYFGIRDIYPDGLGSDMQRYNFLSRYALRNDGEEEELQRLHKKLEQAGILPEWPIVAREAAISAETAIASAKPPRRTRVKK